MFLTCDEVAARYGVCNPTIWRWQKNRPDFPKAIAIGPKASRWLLRDLENWERKKFAERGAGAA
ncbi:AlpA family phage regulatory protein [Thioclava sp. DLFJ5-1]|uniref:helix-turn-helix transcriptional regulator n=1 Tax=Thioclava sp. DLFJ5-1 TaxID=1915314 RepID=UPI001AF012EB|nr:AlpA family phage regulatory protein [Thioclava sp. DLFJ5-1]